MILFGRKYTMSDLNIWLAFGAGLLSFISPCCLPIYPAFLSYITGKSFDNNSSSTNVTLKSLLNTLFFILGFSSIFIALGFSTSIIGSIFINYQDLIRQLGAILIVFFGVVILGLYKPKIMMQEKRYMFKSRPSGYIGTFFIGMAFAAGWTPCTGPILASVISLSATNPSSGLIYMIAYSLGFSIPFFVLSFFLGKVKLFNKYSNRIMKIGGVIMIFMGIILYFDWLTKIIIYFTRLTGGFQGF